VARFRYFLSPSSQASSPRIDELLSIEADSRESAIQLISDKDEAPPQWPSVWLHLLLWSDEEQGCFESMRLR
jgi:hypothetical protein